MLSPPLGFWMRSGGGDGGAANRVGVMFLEVSIITLSFASLSFVCWYCCKKRQGSKTIPIVQQALIPPQMPPPVETIDQTAFDDVEADIREDDTSTQASSTYNNNNDELEEEYTPIKRQGSSNGRGSFRTTPSPRRPASLRRMDVLLEDDIPPSCAPSPTVAAVVQPIWKVKRKDEQSRARQSEIMKRRTLAAEPV